MKRSGVLARPALTVPAVALLAALSACGNGGSSTSSDSPSASSPSSQESSTAAAGAEPGKGADGECGGGFKTKIVKAARGVEVTVPVDWQVQSFKAGTQNRLYPPDRDVGDGYLNIQPSAQTLDEAAQEVLEFTAESAKTTSTQDLDLEGFDGARMVTFEYDDGTFAVDVVAVAEGFRLQANMTREGVPEEQPVAESCLSSITRVK